MRVRSSIRRSLQNCRLMSQNKTVTEKLSFVHCICIENLPIVIHLVYRFLICFTTARFIKFSYKTLAHFLFKLLQIKIREHELTGLSGAEVLYFTAVNPFLARLK